MKTLLRDWFKLTLMMALATIVMAFPSSRCLADQIVRMQLYRVVFSDGSPATGTFDYDFTTDVASNVSIYAGPGRYDRSAAAPTEITRLGIAGTYDSATTSDCLQLSFLTSLDPLQGALISTDPSLSFLMVDNSPGNGATYTLTVTSGSVVPFASLPSTKVAVVGKAGTNGWFQGPATVTLTAAPGVRQVAATYYVLDGGAATHYNAPFTVSTEASHLLLFWTVDSAGYTETRQTANVKVDATAPSTTAMNYGQTVSLAPYDAVSGVAATYYTVNGGARQVYLESFYAPVGTDKVVYWSVDIAGNVESAHTLSFTTGDTQPPSAPGRPHWVTKTVAGGSTAWTASIDNVGVVGYRILQYRGHSGRGGGYSWYQLATTTQTRFNVGATFNIGVQAFDAAGNRSPIAGVQ